MKREFAPPALQDIFQHHLGEHWRRLTYWVAFSGGADSTALLHALYLLHQQQALSVRAIHVNHQLQAQAEQWQQHCQQLCQRWQIPLTVEQVRPDVTKHSIETAARLARYQAFDRQLPKDAVLLTAHHADDQTETLLLQLFRGAGPRGMAAMPPLRDRQHYRHFRPLLGIAGQALRDYCLQAGVSWVEDPSNASLDMDRNYLRHQIIPSLEQRWPNLHGRLALSRELFAQSMQLTDELARVDYGAEQFDSEFPLSKLGNLSQPRQKNLLLAWLRETHGVSISPQQLDNLFTSMLAARVDAQPVMQLGAQQLHRYRDKLYLVEPLDRPSECQTWDWQQDQNIAFGGQTLRATPSIGKGLNRTMLPAQLQLRWRQGGEKIRVQSGPGGHRALKKLLQEWQIPPWERDQIPLVFADDRLICIPGFAVDGDFAATGNEESIEISIG